MNIQMVWAVVLAIGIPSSIVGIFFRRIEKRIEAGDKAKTEKEAAQRKNQEIMIKMAMASLSLGEATAEAVQRIPDAHCNGDMDAALKFARETKEAYREFEREQVAKVLI